MADLSTSSKELLNNFGAIKESFSNFIVRPLNAFGLAGFIFDVEGETSINMQAEITDHFTESNNSIQDHIALKPVKISLKHYVGELVYRTQDDSEDILQQVTQKLTIVNNYLPQLTAGAKQLKSLYQNKNKFSLSGAGLKNLAQNSDKLANLWALIKNLNPPIPRQAQAFMFFEALFQQKILLSLQTPYKFYTNMAIESIVAKQGEESKYISDFSITLKQIRKAQKYKLTKFNESKYKSEQAQEKTNYQKSPIAEVFKTQGEVVQETPVQSITENVTNFNVETPEDFANRYNENNFIVNPLPTPP